MLRLSIDWLKDTQDDLMQCICYTLKRETFKKGDKIIEAGEKLTKIYIIQQGYVDVNIKTSIFESFCFQRLYPGCVFGSHAFFVDEESDSRSNKFTLTAETDGSYISLSYKELFSIVTVEEKMIDLIT